jgi:hypothetical protein
VSKTTLTGRQWGIAPRLGLSLAAVRYSTPNSSSVAGSGFYYDRGELFTYLSPGYAAGEIDGGPFGVVQTEPFVNQQHCSYSSSYNAANPTYLYLCQLRSHLRREQLLQFHNGTVCRQLGNSIWPRPWGHDAPRRPPSNPKAADSWLIIFPTAAKAIIDGTVGKATTAASLIRWAFTTAPTSCLTA